MLMACDWSKKYCRNASSPVKPLPSGEFGFGSAARSRSSRSLRTNFRLFAISGSCSAACSSSATVGRRRLDGVLADLRGLAERLDGGLARADEGLQVAQQRAELAAGGVEVLQRGHLLVGDLAEAHHRRAQLAQEHRQALEARRGSRSTGVGRDGAVSRGLLHEVDDVAAVAGQLAHDGVGVARELLRVWFCRARRRRTRSVSRSAGTARRTAALRSSARPPTPAPSSPRMIRKPLAVRAPQDVVDEVERDRRRGLRDRDRRALGQLLLRACRAGSRRSTRR